MQTKILFENEHFLAADKPSGWLTVPSRIGAKDPRPCLGIELERGFGRIFPVHRLDEEVSGIVLYARNAEAHKLANAWFEERLVHKKYEAWTEGTPPDHQHFEWHSNLLRGKRRAYEADHGKPSITRAHFLGEVQIGGQSTLHWMLEPLTGRSHQLRFELTKQGYPILGDELYASKRVFKENTIALRSVEIDFSRCAEAGKHGLPESLKASTLSEVFGG